jgi:hypothetical protein
MGSIGVFGCVVIVYVAIHVSLIWRTLAEKIIQL